MLTGEIRNQVDAIWNTFWSGGIANPLEVIEQITYLLFIRRLDVTYNNWPEFVRRVGAVNSAVESQRNSLAQLDALFASLQPPCLFGEL